MVVTAKNYGNFLVKALNKEIDYDSDTIKVMLCTALTIDDTDVYLADVTRTESSGTGYTAGGKALTGKSVTYGTNQVNINADNVVWTSSSITASYAIVYDDTPATDKPLIGYVNFGESKTSESGSFTLAWADGKVSYTNIN